MEHNKTDLRFRGRIMFEKAIDKYPSPWMESDLGKQLIHTIKQQLHLLLPHHFGFYLVQCGREECTHWLDASPIQEKIILSNHPIANVSKKNIIYCDFQSLPFDSNSIDMLFLPCILETQTQLPALFEELWRVLLPGGMLILFGLNPYSLLGLKHFLMRHKNEFPWQGQFWSSHQIKKWLLQSDYMIEHTGYFSFHPSLTHLEKCKHDCYHRLGGLYQIIATKQILSLTSIKPKWRIALTEQALLNPSSQS